MIVLATVVALVTHAAMYGPQAAFIAELFSTKLRYSGASMGYQIAGVLGGGDRAAGLDRPGGGDRHRRSPCRSTCWRWWCSRSSRWRVAPETARIDLHDERR